MYLNLRSSYSHYFHRSYQLDLHHGIAQYLIFLIRVKFAYFICMYLIQLVNTQVFFYPSKLVILHTHATMILYFLLNYQCLYTLIPSYLSKAWIWLNCTYSTRNNRHYLGRNSLTDKLLLQNLTSHYEQFYFSNFHVNQSET